MIPILFPANETEFTTNGLGALSDASSCTVTEERNGSYELEMQYPVKGHHYSDIALDTIILAQPADGKDPQPFQVYKISTPINDIVTISAQHISYRLSFIPVAPLTTTGASSTLNGLKTNSIVEHPFAVWTDIDNTTSKYSRLYPSSFRECIGGTEGSFLDVFGGEIEWDKFNVNLRLHRGSDKGVRISYSKNLTDFKNEEDNNGVITGVYPYWMNSETSEIVTCGIVYAIKDYGYSPILPQESSPIWKNGTYYRIKTDGYYQNDEDLVPDWEPNKYYYIKQSGYYNVEDTVAPAWEPDKYYSVLPYGFFNISGETAPEFVYDTYYEKLGEEYIQLSEEVAPEWKSDTYYKNIGTTYSPEYEITTEKPSNWDTNYNDYFIKEASSFEVLTAKPHDWEDNYSSYYIYVKPEYLVTTSQPANWNTNYKGYFVHYTYDENNPIYILTTSEPYDWYESYNKYFEHYYQKEGIVDYIVTTTEPSDWSTNYTNYFTYWEEKYSEDYPFSRLVTMDCSSDFQYKPTKRLLRRYATNYVNSTSLTEKSISLSISFVALWQTEEYKNIAPLERVNLCDTVTVDLKSGDSLNSVKLKVIKTTYDVLSERYTEIELGNSTSSLSNTISNINNTISEAISDTMSTLQSSLAYQAKLMNGALGGNVKINYNAKGLPCEFIIGDSDDISKMVNCLRINYRGIGFSKNGYSGPYTSIWGLDGEFDGQCIKAGSIDGVSIKANTVQASSLTAAAKEELLENVTESISELKTGLDGLTDLSGWLRVEDGHLFIGDKNSTIVIVQGSFTDDSGHTYQKISFVDMSTDPAKELAYISNNRFYTNEMMLGGYKLSASKNAKEGLSFRWVETADDINE